jgi:hypothetical protein
MADDVWAEASKAALGGIRELTARGRQNQIRALFQRQPSTEAPAAAPEGEPLMEKLARMRQAPKG